MSLPNSSSSSSVQDLPSADALRTVYADKHLGECLEFGRYPQGANGEIEPITWRVLLREADHLLVIAEQCLDCKPYNTEDCAITWAGCSLRRWLNDEFMSEAFNEQERKCVLKTSVENNVGPNTADYVFLLRIDETSDLFANDRTRRVKPTEYAVKNGTLTDDNGCCWWWLRSHGSFDKSAAIVHACNSVHDSGYIVDNALIAVRPAFRIAL